MKYSLGKKAAWMGVLFSLLCALFAKSSRGRFLQVVSGGTVNFNRWFVARRNSPYGSPIQKSNRGLN